MIPRHLMIAFAEIGIREVNGSGSNARVDEYLKTVDLSDDSTPWCSAFVNWCIETSGIKGTRNPAARSWLNWGVSCKPQLGCIVVLKRGNFSWQGHVGFYLNDEGDRIYLLGGNQANMVCVKSYLKSDVLDYRKVEDDE